MRAKYAIWILILVIAGFIFLITGTGCTSDSMPDEMVEEPGDTIDILENIKAGLYKDSTNEFLFLTINLHTYQESNQEEKFDIVAELIGRMDVDFVALQECAQHKNSELAAHEQDDIRVDNMALILADKISTKYGVDYTFAWDWAHYGWEVWEEGIAVFSPHIRLDSDSRYVSSIDNQTNIQSRKVIYGSYQVPGVGIINLFSAHTHWRTSETSGEQNAQMHNIRAMVTEKEDEAGNTDVYSFMCGDLNSNPTDSPPWNQGYTTMVGNDYTDTFLEIYPDANDGPNSAYNTIGGSFPGRIDFVLMKENADFEVVDAQIVFTSDVAGRVSDHKGVLTKVRYIR